MRGPGGELRRHHAAAAVVGPPGAGKTLIATSLALYLHLASAKAVFVDKTPDKTGARLISQHVKLAADLEEARAMGARYVVIDSPPYEMPKAQKYILVVEPFDLKHLPELDDDTFLVVNKSKAIIPRENHVAFVDEIHWYMASGVHPLLGDSPRMAKLRRRMGRLLRRIAEWL